MSRLRVLLWFLVAITCTTQAQAQADLIRADFGGSYIRFAEPGDVTITVSVWGDVGGGLYEITQGTHLSTLLTITGGPRVGGGSSGSRATQLGVGFGRIVGSMTIRVLREEGGVEVPVFEQTMVNNLEPLENDIVLQNDDLIFIEADYRRTVGWRDVLSIVGSVGSTVFLVRSLIDLAQGSD